MKSTPLIKTIYILFVSLFCLLPTANAAPGDLDTTFSGDGKYFDSFRDINYRDFATGTAIQADGKIVVIGGSLSGADKTCGAARFNADGSLDTTFAGTGKTLIDIGGAWICRALVVQPDGKIVITGEADDEANDFVVVRLNTDGTFDTTFNGTGKSIRSFSPRQDFVYSVKLQPDGKILFSGEGQQPNSNEGDYSFLVVRLNADGSLDTTFDNDGAVFTPVWYVYEDLATNLLVQPDGKIVATGFTRGGLKDFAAVRYNADGSLDTGFCNNGIVKTDIAGYHDFAWSSALQPDGKIIIAGTSNLGLGTYAFSMVRYTADGSLDTTFDGDGKVTTPFGTNSYSEIKGIAVQKDGKILVAGLAYGDFALGRYNADGSPDSSFWNPLASPYGTNGIVTYDISGGDWLNSMAVDNEGRVVAVGESNVGGPDSAFSVARFLPNDSVLANAPFDFDGDRKTDISIYRPGAGEWWINRSSTNLPVAAQFGAATDKIVPGDFTGDGKTDIAVWRPATGEWFVLRSEDSSFYSIPFGSNGDVPVPADYDGDGKTDIAVYRPSNSIWYISKSSGGYQFDSFGAAGDVPVVGDYDRDGNADLAIYRPSMGAWWIQKSGTTPAVTYQFGNSTDIPVQGDYSGDGRTDSAVWRPSTGEWFILRSEDNSYYSFSFGTAGDIPIPGDYDGDGKSDTAVFRPNDTNWYVNRSTAGLLIMNFGLGSDRPVPSAFVP